MPGDATWQRLHERAHEQAEEAHRREHDNERRSIDLAAEANNRRLAELNKLREEVIDDRAQFLRADTYQTEHKALRAMVDSKMDAVTARVDSLEKQVDQARGAVLTWRFIAMFAGLPGLAALFGFLVTLFDKSAK